MIESITLTFLAAWFMVFVPIGTLGLGLWALWRLIPRLRKSMGYKHPFSR